MANSEQNDTFNLKDFLNTDKEGAAKLVSQINADEAAKNRLEYALEVKITDLAINDKEFRQAAERVMKSENPLAEVKDIGIMLSKLEEHAPSPAEMKEIVRTQAEEPEAQEAGAGISAKSTRRGGFTLLETLIVTAILALSIGLLLPAVHKVRERARDMKNTNNMRQTIAGAHNFETAHGYFPASMGRNNDKDRQMVSGFVHLLPYLEADPVYRLYDPTKPPEGQSQAFYDAAKAVPALTENGHLTQMFVSGSGLTNTRVEDIDGALGFFRPQDRKNDGAFPVNLNGPQGNRPLDITDGLSNTIGIGPKVVRNPDDINNYPFLNGEHQVPNVAGVGKKNDKRDAGLLNNHLSLNGSVGVGHEPDNLVTEGIRFAGHRNGTAQFANMDGSVRTINTQGLTKYDDTNRDPVTGKPNDPNRKWVNDVATTRGGEIINLP